MTTCPWPAPQLTDRFVQIHTVYVADDIMSDFGHTEGTIEVVTIWYRALYESKLYGDSWDIDSKFYSASTVEGGAFAAALRAARVNNCPLLDDGFEYRSAEPGTPWGQYDGWYLKPAVGAAMGFPDGR